MLMGSQMLPTRLFGVLTLRSNPDPDALRLQPPACARVLVDSHTSRHSPILETVPFVKISRKPHWCHSCTGLSTTSASFKEVLPVHFRWISHRRFSLTRSLFASTHECHQRELHPCMGESDFHSAGTPVVLCRRGQPTA